MNDFRIEDEIEGVVPPTGRGESAHAHVASAEVSAVINSAVMGVLVGFKDDSRTPLVMYPGQPGSAALPARVVPDIHGSHIGRQVVLMFDHGDPQQPIIMGCLRSNESWPIEKRGQVEVDADGERLVVTAKERLVLRCGKASVTLTKEGKVTIEGTYVSSRSSGVNRIKGGSVQLN
jgi:hypothetical protein